MTIQRFPLSTTLKRPEHRGALPNAFKLKLGRNLGSIGGVPMGIAHCGRISARGNHQHALRVHAIAAVGQAHIDEMRSLVENLFAFSTMLSLGSLVVYTHAKISQCEKLLEDLHLSKVRFAKEEANLHVHHQMDLENALSEIDELKRALARLQSVQKTLKHILPFVNWD